ncbi:TetR/AcrR family transcriptional regulator [Cellulosimicrobium sp. TH-20]|uniref:TetR family transcriptional regulator n=1 Tax=Cellulosimicrobium sp. TH-20 TaxID=1980001 RepID=UPI00158249F7
MQDRRRTNAERTHATRAALVAAARDLFVRAGYAATSTPQIAAAANVTRGALYHHYADKQDLFRAVAEAEAEAVAREIEACTAAPDAGKAAPERSDAPDAPDAPDARAMLVEGARAYLDAMGEPGRTRLLLVDAPAVLGPAEADALDARHARRTLREGLGAALGAHPSGDSASHSPDEQRLDALTLLLSAAFDRAALALDAGAAPGPVRAAVTELVDRVCAPSPEPRPRS